MPEAFSAATASLAGYVRGDGSWLVDAALEPDGLKQLLGVKTLPGEEQQAYETLGGFVLHQMQRIPREGEHFVWNGFRFEIADMDRHRLDKVLIQPPGPAASFPHPPT